MSFDKHQIAKDVNNHFETVMKSSVLKSFAERNKYKSQKTREADEATIDFLLKHMRFFANGWIAANTLSTGELYRKNEILDQMAEQNIKDRDELRSIFKEMNDHSNRQIKELIESGILKGEKLEELREMERNVQKEIKSWS